MMGKSVFEGYWLDDRVGEGAFGTVYRIVKQDETGTYTRALKEITIPTDAQYQEVLSSMGGDRRRTDQYFEEVWKNTKNEIRILNTLTEKGVKNIVFYYENKIIKEENPLKYRIFIMMEYLTSLKAYMINHSMCVGDVVRLGNEILEALSYCHANHIIHRDVKEDNIFITDDGTFKLGDFGVSRILAEGSQAQSMKGTMNYIAPEVYLGRGTYDETVDLYSMGIVLYRMLNYSRNPFMPDYPGFYTDDDVIQARTTRLSGKVPPLPALARNSLGEVIQKAVSPRDRRFHSASEFQRAWSDAARKLSPEDLRRPINHLSEETKQLQKQTSVIPGEDQQEETLKRNEFYPKEFQGEVGETPFDQSFREPPGFSLDKEQNQKDIVSKEEKQEESGIEKRSQKSRKTMLVLLLIVVLAVAGGGFFWVTAGRNLIKGKNSSGVMVVDAMTSVIPYANLSLDLSIGELKELYGNALSEGAENQYYLELQGEEELQTVMILFDENGEEIKQISLGRKAEDQEEFLKSITAFYSSWTCVNAEGPYRYQKDNTEVMITYDEGNQMAYISVNRIHE